MESVEDVVSDDKITIVWGNADFGDISRRDVIANSLLKYACGFFTGKTARVIITELGLLDGREKLTTMGRRYLWAAYSKNQSV